MGIATSALQTRSHAPTNTGPLVVMERLTGRLGLRIAGEIDRSNCAGLHRMLPDCPAAADVHLELAGLEFIDAAGTTALAIFARRLATGARPRRLVLHAPPHSLRRVAELLWPDATWTIEQP